MSNKLGIDNLKFFTSDGYQIQMQKRYSVSWEIVPADCIYGAFVKNPKGHFEVEPEKDITDVLNDEHSVVIDGITTSQDIPILPNTTYKITVCGVIKKAVAVHNRAHGVVKSFDSESVGATTFMFTSSAYPTATHFVVKTVNNEMCRITYQNNNAVVVVDDCGIIKKNVSFYRKNCDNDYILNKNGNYVEIDDYNTQYTLDDIFDVIFFSYKYENEIPEKWRKPDGDIYNVNYINNKIRITILTDEGALQEDFELNDFFVANPTVNINKLKEVTAWVGDGDFLADESSSNTMYGLTEDVIKQVQLKNSDFDDEDKNDKVYGNWSTSYYIIKTNLDDRQYPYIRYIGTVTQDKTSTNFISTSTIIVVDDVNGDGTQYDYPNFYNSDTDTQYRLHFTFQKDSEMKFIISNDNVNVMRLDSFYSLLPSEKKERTTAINFTVGCEASVEGCYQNTMGMFLRDDRIEKDYFIGVIIFKTEVEDEDERYRTLMTNFGVPDPINFPNIFKSQDVDEEGTDWTLVNNKAKELFINYDNIFPYVGTYKALFNAIKYLGYQDIIFKEWYKILDNNDNTKFVAVQTHNTSDGSYIENSLRNYGVEYGEYDRYTKLNRLSMVYHMQTINNNSNEQQLHTVQEVYKYKITDGELYLVTEDLVVNLLDNTNDSTLFGATWGGVLVKLVCIDGKYYVQVVNGTFVNKTNPSDKIVVTIDDETPTYISKAAQAEGAYKTAVTTVLSSAMSVEAPDKLEAVSSYYNASDIPSIENVYEYRTDEVLAKLYAVKKWLEKYITGVNCYISDINGEGVVLERFKTVGYVTEHEYKDLTSEGKFTPKCYQKEDNVFTDSSAVITCSLNEFNSLSFEDYYDYPIDRFIKNEYSTRIIDADGNSTDVSVYDSCPLCAMTVADEYQFDVNLDYRKNGSLFEFTDASTLDNPIIINDGEISFFD